VGADRPAWDGRGDHPARSGGPRHGLCGCLRGPPCGSLGLSTRPAPPHDVAGGDRTDAARRQHSPPPHRGRGSARQGWAGGSSPSVSGAHPPVRQRTPGPPAARGQHAEHTRQGQRQGASRRRPGHMARTSRSGGVTRLRTLRSGVHGNGHAPFWNSGRRSAPPIDCTRRFHQYHFW
jgi:hypothetical protein